MHLKKVLVTLDVVFSSSKLISMWSINFLGRDLTWYVWPMPSRTTSPFASLHPLCVKNGSSTLSIWWQVRSKGLCIRCMWTFFWQLCIDNYHGHQKKIVVNVCSSHRFPYGAMSTRIRQWHSWFVIKHMMTDCGHSVFLDVCEHVFGSDHA